MLSSGCQLSIAQCSWTWCVWVPGFGCHQHPSQPVITTCGLVSNTDCRWVTLMPMDLHSCGITMGWPAPIPLVVALGISTLLPNNVQHSHIRRVTQQAWVMTPARLQTGVVALLVKWLVILSDVLWYPNYDHDHGNLLSRLLDPTFTTFGTLAEKKVKWSISTQQSLDYINWSCWLHYWMSPTQGYWIICSDECLISCTFQLASKIYGVGHKNILITPLIW